MAHRVKRMVFTVLAMKVVTVLFNILDFDSMELNVEFLSICEAPCCLLSLFFLIKREGKLYSNYQQLEMNLKNTASNRHI
jgi:hypothetical protein